MAEDIIAAGAEFSEEFENDVVNAGLCFAAEKKALDYLNRSEQCRSGLFAKLVSKGFDKENINKALDYLEQKKDLDDFRFATAWLNNRKITHAEGRAKLSAELFSRGIKREFVETALDEFFTENSENDLCLRAYKKCLRLKKSDDKTTAYLLKNGFSIKLIQSVKDYYATEE